jgi:ppGpp synthetase/RelA/SpoT-type nucleotidyltranferase
MDTNYFFGEIKSLKDLMKANEVKVFSYFNIQDEIDEIHVKFHHLLCEILGKPNALADNGGLKSEFNYEGNDFILFSFKSYKGQIPANVQMGKDENKILRRRYNLYRKGKIWSGKNFYYGKNFYLFLDQLDDVFHETPISLLSYCLHTYKMPTSACHIEITQDYDYSRKNNCIFFPSKADLDSINNEYLNQILDIFQKYLNVDFLSNPFEVITGDLESLRNAKPQIIRFIDNELFYKVITQFTKVFNIPKTSLEDGSKFADNESLKLKIFFASILYLYNHLPYNLHLFYPSVKDVSIDDLFTIIVAKESPKKLVSGDKKLFLKLASSSPNIPRYEFIINEKAGDNAGSLLRWKYIYEQNLDKYATFMHASENICNSLIKQSDIKAIVSSRLKTFEGFYNKLIDRANDNKALKDSYFYIDAIHQPDKMKELVFQDIRDIAGVRIVCVFNDDVWSFDKIFQSINNGDDLICSDFKRYEKNRKVRDDQYYNDEEYNYRGFHVSIAPGNTRKKLIEYKDIWFVQCEIQVRTNFAHGWSNVEHPLIYKDTLHLNVVDPDFNDLLICKLGEISRSLKDHDELISALNSERNKYTTPISE